MGLLGLLDDGRLLSITVLGEGVRVQLVFFSFGEGGAKNQVMKISHRDARERVNRACILFLWEEGEASRTSQPVWCRVIGNENFRIVLLLGLLSQLPSPRASDAQIMMDPKDCDSLPSKTTLLWCLWWRSPHA